MRVGIAKWAGEARVRSLRSGTAAGLAALAPPEARPNIGIQRLAVRGRRRELGLGAVALVSLAEAREQAFANRKLARSGGDPLAERRRAAGMPAFADAARRVVEQKQGGWRGPAKLRLGSAEPRTVRVPAHRQPARLRGQQRRRARDPHAHLARPGRAPAHPLGAGVGDRDGPAKRQPVRLPPDTLKVWLYKTLCSSRDPCSPFGTPQCERDDAALQLSGPDESAARESLGDLVSW